jgi:hypothetical protein
LFDRLAQALFANILIALSLLWLACRTVFGSLKSVVARLGCRRHPGRSHTTFSPSLSAGIGQFDFEHAIEAYEQLIDSTAAGDSR